MFTFVIGISCRNTSFVQNARIYHSCKRFCFRLDIFRWKIFRSYVSRTHRVCKPKPVLITKKEKYPLKPRCSLNNKNVMRRTCSAKQIKNQDGFIKFYIHAYSSCRKIKKPTGTKPVGSKCLAKSYFKKLLFLAIFLSAP